jgi:hypothetical protein
MEGSMGPMAGLSAIEKRKSYPGRPNHIPSLYRLSCRGSKTDKIANIKTEIDLAYLKQNIFFLAIHFSLIHRVKGILYKIVFQWHV